MITLYSHPALIPLVAIVLYVNKRDSNDSPPSTRPTKGQGEGPMMLPPPPPVVIAPPVANGFQTFPASGFQQGVHGRIRGRPRLVCKVLAIQPEPERPAPWLRPADGQPFEHGPQHCSWLHVGNPKQISEDDVDIVGVLVLQLRIPEPCHRHHVVGPDAVPDTANVIEGSQLGPVAADKGSVGVPVGKPVMIAHADQPVPLAVVPSFPQPAAAVIRPPGDLGNELVQGHLDGRRFPVWLPQE